MATPTFLRKLTAKVGKPTTFDVVPAEQSAAMPGLTLRERRSALHTR